MADEAVTTRRKKSGFPNQSSFHDSQMVHSFSKISRALIDSKSLPWGLKLDEQSLSNVSFQLQTFMESSLGKTSAISTRSITKIPQGNFRDYSVDGSLMNILLVALKHQLNAGWEIFSLAKPDRHSHGLEIIRDAEAALLENRMLRRPQVYIGRVPAHAIPKLKQIVNQHGGSIVETVAAASHVVDWDEEVDSLPSELTEEFVRTLEVRPSDDSGTALVHWFYHPDSYDEWIPSDHVDGSEPPDTVPQPSELNIDRQWHVCCRYVMDCEIFNEWGNEIDYENLPDGEGDDDDTNDDASNEKSPVKASAGRKARGRRRLDAVKAKKIPILESIAVTEKMMQDVPPPLHDPTLETATVVEILVCNECQLISVKNGSTKLKQSSSSAVLNLLDAPASEAAEESVLSAVGSKRKADGSDEAVAENSVPAVIKQKKDKTSGRKASHQSQLKLPSWYNSELLNALEIKYLPDLFATAYDRAQSSTEYFRLRNFIVALYAHNPLVYLSATDCRRKLSGDVCAVLRIHSFLDAFGVINFNIKADCRPLLGQASLSHWNEDLLSSCTSSILHAPAGSSSAVKAVGLLDQVDVEWSESMDSSLRRCAVKTKGDWSIVAAKLAHEYSECAEGPWDPTPEECLARFVSLAIPAPIFAGTMVEGSAALALAAIAGGSNSQKMKFLASQIADRAVTALGREAMTKLVSTALLPIAAKTPRTVVKDDLKGKDSLFSCDSVTFRLDSLERKMKLISDVDRMIDLERDRVEIDMRDIQMQRSQLCLQPSSR